MQPMRKKTNFCG